MAHDARDLGLATGADLAVQPLYHVQATGPQLPAPAEVADAVLPVFSAGKGRDGVDGVADEAADGVGVKAEQKGNKEVVSVPKGLKRLLADLCVGGRVHEQHAEEHDVAGDAAGLLVVNVYSEAGAQLGSFDVEEAGLGCQHVCMYVCTE